MPCRSRDNAALHANGENFTKKDLYMVLVDIMTKSPNVPLFVIGRSEGTHMKNLPGYADIYKMHHHTFWFQFNAMLRGGKQQTEHCVYYNNKKCRGFVADPDQQVDPQWVHVKKAKKMQLQQTLQEMQEQKEKYWNRSASKGNEEKTE
eukprot:15324162-Ditylum_brightwellii.AAC.1